MSATPRTYDSTTNGVEASPFFKVSITPTSAGDNIGVACTLKTASERSWEPGLGADVIMGSNGVPVAVVRTETKPSGSIGALLPSEKDFAVDHIGGFDGLFNMTWTISGPGFVTQTHNFIGCMMSGGGGTEANTGSVPSSGFDFIFTAYQRNNKWVIGGPNA